MPQKNTRYLQIIAYAMIAAIFIFVMGITRNCGRISSLPLEGYSGGDTLDIAFLYVPGGYYIYGDTLSGINLSVARQFSEETGTPIKTWNIADPAEGMAKLESGAFDIVASLPLDNYIKNRFNVSESVFLDRLVLVQLVDSVTNEKPVSSSLDLNGKTVYVTAGSSALQRMKNLAEEIGGNIKIEEVPEHSDELLTLKIANGTLPLAVVNEKVAKKIAESYPNLNYDTSVSFTQFQVWVFNPTDSLLSQKFNKWFDGYRNTDTYRSILNNY
ncbi:MAG: transporter substrate-binding domain-containing protein [Muribaculaceae bacterium]|nr:transporter substrate-binding domain-containing protein [Muribaculaceae bacterium]